jgi:hypothetical protein
MSRDDAAPGSNGGPHALEVAACRKQFADFARQTSNGTPFYSRIAAGIAADPDLAALLTIAPEQQRLPVLLLACVHSLVLDEPDSELAAFYPNLAGPTVVVGDPMPALRAFCASHRDQLGSLLTTRHTQTNEIGRTALFLPCFGELERVVGPVAHIDVGASAGLNLLLPRYDFVYEPGGTVAAGSVVRLTCGTRGPVPVPERHPIVAAAVGIDPAPIDVRDPEQARWLEACVWPDQVERFERLGAAIGLARDLGVDVRRGDAVGDIARVVSEQATHGHPVVTTSWVMNYLTADERRSFVAELDRIGSTTDVSFVYAESPGLCPELPGIPPASATDQPTALVIVRWRGGRRLVSHVADAHPHGAWMHWIPGR